MDKALLARLRQKAIDGLEETLAFFGTAGRDPSGGYWGEVDRELAPVPGAARSLVLIARLVWTFSAAYRVLGRREHLAWALHAYDYLKQHFIDPEYGGGYWSVGEDGAPLDTRKLVYGQAFIIYGGSELYRALQNEKDPALRDTAEEALRMATGVYKLCEQHALDRVNGGYFESYDRQWNRLMESFNIPDPKLGSKALNTHLHVIESYTNLMRVWDDEGLRARVGELIDIMSNKLLDREIFHYKPYMTDDWSTTKSLVSFGHDIEGSWLLIEAAQAFGDAAIVEANKPVAVRIAKACYEGGVDRENGGMLYEHHVEDDTYEEDVSWWVQAEAVVGLFNAYELTREEIYLTWMLEMWDYIDNNVIDRVGGVFRDWITSANLPPDHPRNAHPITAWKTPYHNGRMYLELIERIDHLIGAPS
jgi:mannobiose 2-epimerase